MRVSVTQNVTIDATPTRFMTSETEGVVYWRATLYVNNADIATVGVNGDGSYRTREAAIKAAVRLARDRGWDLTVHRG